MSKKKIGVLIGVVAVVAALGGTGYYFRDEIKDMIPNFQEGNQNDKVYVEKVSKIMNQYAGASNRYNGTVESQDTYEVNVDTSRTIEKIQVEAGDTVEEGQTLVSYDISDIKMQIAQANLEIESVNNDIENYKKQIDTLTQERDKAAEAEKFSYTTQIQSLENNIAQKNFDLESKNLEISKFQNKIDNSTVKSKVSGVVKEINEKGMDSNGNSAPFMKILQTGEYRIKGSIDEQNVWTLAEGQNVVIRSRVDSEQTWNGAIGKIDTDKPLQNNNGNSYYVSSSSDGAEQAATKYPFYIDLESADGLILGQHVYIELDEGQEEEKEGLWLSGVYIIQDGENPYVWAANEKERLEMRSVELGEYDAELDEYEILSGLTEDDYLTFPMPGLHEGIITVTDAQEVDYSSPLYNQPMDDDMEGEAVYGTESVDLNSQFQEEGTESYPQDGMTDGIEGTEVPETGMEGTMKNTGDAEVAE